MSTMSWFLGFLYSQLLVTPPTPVKSFAEQTVIVTGSNTGLGLDAARHMTRLNAAKVILAVRNTSKGEAAKKSIEESTGRLGVVEVWPLDLSSYESVKQFTARASKELKRIDVLLENAGMMVTKFEITEEDESTVTTNVVSTFLLGLLLLPKLRETAQRYNVTPRLTVVSSDLHFVTAFHERNANNIFEALSDKENANMGERLMHPERFPSIASLLTPSNRYATTKLLEILLVRQISSRITSPATKRVPVIVNTLTPGACRSDFFREEQNFLARTTMAIAKRLLARTAEVGSRTLVAAASGGEETAGKYMADSVVSYESPFVLSEEGERVGEKVWRELMEKLERIQPGISKNV